MQNLTLFQFFHWYYNAEGNLWQHAKRQASHLSQMGITHVWLPPAYKSAYGTEEPGYAVYDLYDLGEFDQKGTIRTKYGTREEYRACIDSLHQNGIQVLADIVLNHRHGADEKEKFQARKVDLCNRNEFIGDEEQIEGWTKFTFPGRKGRYSHFEWNWHAFTGISEDPEHIFLILNEYANGSWEEMIEDEQGNYDYLMGADVDFRNPFVKEELTKWGEWYMESMGIDGLRLDAVKHIPYRFFNDWLDHLRAHFKKDFLCIGEYWRPHADLLQKYIELTEGRIQLFDVPLHFNFHEASVGENKFDMRRIFDNSLVQKNPARSITFVDNHDTQPMQSLQSTVEYWFKPHAYALILLREQGLPCVFYPAVYEAKYTTRKNGEEIYVELNAVPHLERMIKTRKELAYGIQRDYFDHSNTIGWIRAGIDERPGSGCAVVLTNGSAGYKVMEIGKHHAGKIFVDVYGHPEKVKVNEEGWAEFLVRDKSASIWVREDAINSLG